MVGGAAGSKDATGQGSDGEGVWLDEEGEE